MPTTTDVENIISILRKLYPNPVPPLKHKSAFDLLIAVILSAQCTDKRVNQITPALFPKDTACTPSHILTLSSEKVREIIRPCGYHNQKTASIIGCAKALKNNKKSENKIRLFSRDIYFESKI